MQSRLSGLARFAALYVGLLAVSLGLYHGLWQNQFYKDDYQWIVDARDIARNPGALLRPHPDNSEFVVRQTQRILFTGLYRLWGARPTGYYIVGLLLHALAATLVFAILRRLALRRDANATALHILVVPAAGALWFASSSHHAAAVLWLAAQSSILVTIALEALFLYALRNERRSNEPRVLLGLAALFLVALYSKNVAATFPLVLAVLFASDRRSPAPRRGLLVSTGLLGLMGLAQVLFTKAYLGRVHVAGALTTHGAASYRLGANVPANLAGAFLGCFLSPSEYERLFGGWLPYGLCAVVLGAFFVACMWRARYRAEMLLGLVWLLAMALPTCLFDYVQYAPLQQTVDRYYYPSMVGATILVAFLMLSWLERWRNRGAAVAVVTVLVVAHVATQYGTLQARRMRLRDYESARMVWIDGTRAAARKMQPGTVIYALHWEEPDALVRGVSRLYFEDAGIRLAGEDEYGALEAADPGDGIRRYAADNDAVAHRMRFHELPPMRLRANEGSPVRRW